MHYIIKMLLRALNKLNVAARVHVCIKCNSAKV